jgi:disulfide bond formation protein DsbB
LIAAAQRFCKENVGGVAAFAAFLASAATIAGFLTFEAMGFQPCELCLLDRKPYYVAAPLALLTFVSALRGATKFARLGLALLTLTFAVGAALCVYHAGVEFHWWAGPEACTGGLPHATSSEDFLTRLKKVKPIRCDAPALLVFGLSLAAWGAFICAGLAMLTAWGWRKAGDDERGC